MRLWRQSLRSFSNINFFLLEGHWGDTDTSWWPVSWWGRLVCWVYFYENSSSCPHMICALFHMYFFTLIKCLLKNDNRPHPISAALGTNSVHCSVVLQRIILQAPVAQVAESVLFGVPVPSGFLSMPNERSHVPQVSPGIAGPCNHPPVLGDRSCHFLWVLPGGSHAHLNISPKGGPKSSTLVWWAGWWVGRGAC